jgi:translation initiation factor 2 alpha subunit (eIF-2alpha)
MIRIYQTMPKCGIVVMAKITKINTQSQLHDCVLLEYGNINGQIIRVNCNNRKAKEFLKLKKGMIVPLVCENISNSNFVSLSFPTLDAQTIKKYHENYQSITRIINTFAMMLSKTNNTIQRPDVLLSNDDDLRNKVQLMINEIMDFFSNNQEEIKNAFFTNTTILHAATKSWKYCQTIPNFDQMLLNKFPFPKKAVVINFTYNNYYCNSVDQMKKTFVNIENAVLEFDQHCYVHISIDTPPHYRINIKNIVTSNLEEYVENITAHITKFVKAHEHFEFFMIDQE